MPLRAMRAALLKTLTDAGCPEDAAASAVRTVIDIQGWRPPARTLETAHEIDALPDGTAVLIVNPGSLTSTPVVGAKGKHCILIAGEDEPWPLFREGLAPPLPCRVIYMREDDH